MSFGKKQQVLVLRRLSALLFRKANFEIQKMIVEVKLSFGKNLILRIKSRANFQIQIKILMRSNIENFDEVKY